MTRLVGIVIALGLAAGCPKDAPEPTGEAADGAKAAAKVGYDVRRLRPRNDEPLAEMFERMRTQALAEGKVVAVLFSADWCEPCRHLDLELGNMHPEREIGHMRILELKEEDWEAVTRINEVNDLRRRWSAPPDAYPVLIVLDDRGEKVEEMKEAVERLESTDRDPTLATWFGEHRPSRG